VRERGDQKIQGKVANFDSVSRLRRRDKSRKACDKPGLKNGPAAVMISDLYGYRAEATSGIFQ